MRRYRTGWLHLRPAHQRTWLQKENGFNKEALPSFLSDVMSQPHRIADVGHQPSGGITKPTKQIGNAGKTRDRSRLRIEFGQHRDFNVVRRITRLGEQTDVAFVIKAQALEVVAAQPRQRRVKWLVCLLRTGLFILRASALQEPAVAVVLPGKLPCLQCVKCGVHDRLLCAEALCYLAPFETRLTGQQSEDVLLKGHVQQSNR